ncbi:MAG: peptidoglycan editing factor PgeF [Ignavibacteriae bacterium]|nr:peptidoglycan editing factor PgeF [Ignavibacteriota bacterium]
MSLQKPKIFSQFPDLIFGFSTRQNHKIDDKFGFNLSKSIGDDEKKVIENRSKFFAEFDLSLENVVIQKQTHSSIVNFVDKFVNSLEGDALITKTKNLGLAVSTADCTNIYIYDCKEKVIAAVHSGWEGTEKKILAKTIQKLKDDFNSNPQNLFIYFGPSISQQYYEVGKEFLNKFDKKYLTQNGEKYLLDLKAANKDMLLNLGVPNSQIEISEICSFENPNFHSYRRDKKNSGRAFGVIAIKGSNE